MDMAGGAIAGSAVAGAVLHAPGVGGGTAYGESVGETIGPVDLSAPHTTFGLVLSESFWIVDVVVAQAAVAVSFAENTALGDAPSAPGGTTSDTLNGAIELAGSFAATGLWTVVAEPDGGWSEVSPGATAWTAAPAASGLWLKH
jgi:hypothetical protein